MDYTIIPSNTHVRLSILPFIIFAFSAFHLHLVSGIESSHVSCDSSPELGRCKFGSRDEKETLLKSTVDNLKAWLMENGAVGLNVADSKLDVDILHGKELGVKAIKDIKEGDVLFKIPSNLIVSEIEAGKEALPYEEAPWDVTMAAWILREKGKGESSFFSPYINSLPSSIPLPHLFPEHILKEIDYSPVIEELGFWKTYIASQFNKSDAAAMADASMDEFAWAMSIVWSRSAIIETEAPEHTAEGKEGEGEGGEGEGEGASGRRKEEADYEAEDYEEEEELNFPSPWGGWANSWAKGEHGRRKGEGEGEGGEEGSESKGAITLHALIPFFDLFNHDFEAEAFWEFKSEEKDEHVHVIANKDSATGQKIHFSYFNFASDWFFLVYGFVPAFNPFEKLVLFSSLEEVSGQAEKMLDLPEKRFGSGSDAFQKASEAFVAVEDQLQVLSQEIPEANLSDYAFEEDAGLWVWNEAHIEPRVFASAAAMWLVHNHGNQSVDVEALMELAHLSIGFGHFPGNITCEKMAETATPVLMEASLFGLRLVQTKLASVLANFKTSLEEDEVQLAQLSQRLQAFEYSEDKEYTNDVELSNAIKFRIGKKKLAKNAQARLWIMCPGEQKSVI